MIVYFSGDGTATDAVRLVYVVPLEHAASPWSRSRVTAPRAPEDFPADVRTVVNVHGHRVPLVVWFDCHRRPARAAAAPPPPRPVARLRAARPSERGIGTRNFARR